jgi:predicted nuclease of predicted toxin-antitoxin system
MAARRRKSRKRSATKPSAPPERIVCFTDECLGRYAVPDALRAAGVDIVLHHELFPSGVDDAEWLLALGKRPELIVLTKDSRIRKRVLERQALEAAKLRVFALTAGNLSGADQGAAFVRALPKIRRLARRPGPFIARVTPVGAVDLI